MQLDQYDVKILQILQKNGRITKSQLADEIHLSISPCWERVKKLERAGVIEGYGARVNINKILKQTSVLVEISLKEHHAQAFKRFEAVINETAEVTDCYATGGGVDYILKVQTVDIDQYQRLMDTWLDSELGIERYYSYIVTKTIKQNTSHSDFNFN